MCAPRDRVKARVPVPLVPVAPRRRAGEGERASRRGACPRASWRAGRLGRVVQHEVVVGDRRRGPARARSTRSTARDVARVVEVGGMQVQPQHAPGERRAGAHQRGRGRALERRGRAEAQRGRVARGARRAARAASPTSRSRRASCCAQRARVRVGGGDEPARRAGRRRRARAAGLDRRRRRLGVQPGVLRGRAALPAAQRPRAAAAGASAGAEARAGRSRRRASRRSSSQFASSGSGPVERVQSRRGDHQQRHPVDARVVEPVADQRAALEGRRLDVVQRDRERARGDSAAARGGSCGSGHQRLRGRRARRRSARSQRLAAAKRAAAARSGSRGAGALDRGEQAVDVARRERVREVADQRAPTARSSQATAAAPLAAASKATRPNVSSSPGMTTQRAPAVGARRAPRGRARRPSMRRDRRGRAGARARRAASCGRAGAHQPQRPRLAPSARRPRAARRRPSRG